MPLPSDERLLALSQDLLQQFDTIFGVHPGFRSAHSTDGFPTRTGREFLEFLQAVAGSDLAEPSPLPVETFLASHPAALAFV